MLGLESAGSQVTSIFPSSVSTGWPPVMSFSVASHCSSKKVQPPHWSLQRPPPFSFPLPPRAHFLLHTMTFQTHRPSRRCHSLLPPSLCPCALHADGSTRCFSHAVVDFFTFWVSTYRPFFPWLCPACPSKPGLSYHSPASPRCLSCIAPVTIYMRFPLAFTGVLVSSL